MSAEGLSLFLQRMAHDHNHSHHHHHHSVNAEVVSGTAFIIGIILNLGFVIAEVIIGFASHSLVLLTDAGHNLGDVAGLVISLLAFRLSKVKPKGVFTYGYRKTTILAALLNAVILFTATLFLGYESFIRLMHPSPVEGGTIAWVAGLGILINGASALVFFKHKDNELNAKGAYLHLLSDTLVSAGVVVAGVIIHFTNWYMLDAIVSLVILVTILISTWSLLKESVYLSLDAVPKDIEIGEIETIIKTTKGVISIDHVHIWAISTTQNALTGHVVLENSLSFDEKIKIVAEIKHELSHHNIQHATIEMDACK